VALAVALAALAGTLVPLRVACAGDIEAAAKVLVGQCAAGDFAAATANFDTRMKEALPAERMATVWSQITASAGAYGGIEAVRTVEKAPYRTVFVTCRFEKAPLDAKVVFDAEEHVAGLFFAPASPPESPWSAPDYVQSDRFEEKPVTVVSGIWKLPGFLCMPKGAGPFPAAVLVHGSGPHDADETILGSKPFRDLAWGLASRGIAVLRYVKRTQVMAEGPPVSLAGLTVREETIDDARAAAALLCRTPGVDSARVFVIGHSLGGLLAPRIARDEPRVAGIVVLAGNARPLEVLALEQLRYIAQLDSTVDAGETANIAAAEKSVRDIQNPALAETTTVNFLGAKIPGSYWLDLRGYHPEKMAAQLGKPVLVLRGERDYQVGAKDFEMWSQALAKQRNATCKQYPALNHLFLAGTGTPGPEEYQTPGHVAADVVTDVAAWINSGGRKLGS
jgi:hypothetical protein